MSSVVPDGWVDSPLGKFLKFRRGTSYVASELSEDAYSHPLYITMKSFKVGGGYSVRGDKYYSPPYDQKQVVEHDEILFANTDVTSSCDILGAPLLLPRKRLRADVLFSHHVTAAKILENVDKDFLFYLLSSPSVRQVVQSCGRGTTVKMLDMKDIGKLSFSLPPLPEQKKIASILTSVDEVIEHTQKKIDKLQDLKKATMNELLTKGIGHTEFKDSELGRIPVSWEVVSCKDICSQIFVGIATSTTHAYTDSSGVVILRNQNILDGVIDKTNLLYISQKFSDENASKKLRVGDVISARTGYPGISAVVGAEFSGCHTFTTLISRPLTELVVPEFYALFFNSLLGRKVVKMMEAGGAQQNLNVGSMEVILIPIPSLSEQNRIVKVSNLLDGQIDGEKGKLTKVESLKKSLMQDLLTGKVRVMVN